ncbi:MAG: thiamine pyrophosphate-dependent enzyme [Planctomycetota bacterium]|jgi:indolepyruvate ferredoxin oxidoreductase alpha subunit
MTSKERTPSGKVLLSDVAVSAGQVLLGDEAVALGAIHAGVSACHAYPGTPSTEILEYLRRHETREGAPKATWCANEKTAYEAALGVSMVGRRTLVCMKHVGLNVAADPFVNSALVNIKGGLVVVVADDPGMHSSQNEQDSRNYAAFARIPCLEPADQQEAYEMTREAFNLSERFHVPVLLRIVTRLAHSRAVIHSREPLRERPLQKPPRDPAWILLPANARRQWRELLDTQPRIHAYSEESSHNRLNLLPDSGRTGVITTGLARNYYLENVAELETEPSHLHIGAYPVPAQKIRALAEQVDRLVILEEGNPYVERQLRGILPTSVSIEGRETGLLSEDGELTPDSVRRALGLPAREGVKIEDLSISRRPPQLCSGCPHADSYQAAKEALEGYSNHLVCADIGCYTLGALPPYSAIQSCVCMGASIGMAKGAADSGHHPVLAVIGDSTFLHSGIPPLVDAVAADADITVLILDNRTVAMTGAQPSIIPSERLEKIVLGLGVDPSHFHLLRAHPRQAGLLRDRIREEVAHRGLSVIIAYRECIESLKKGRRARKAEGVRS